MTVEMANYRRGRLAEAMRDNLQECIVPTSDPHVFSFEGRYSLRFNVDTGRYECECLGWTHRGFCRHLGALMVYMTQQQLSVPRKERIQFSVGGICV